MKYKWASSFIFSLFTAFLLSLTALGQTVQIPEKVQFADLELEIDAEAQKIIGQKTKYLTGNFLRYQKYQEHGRLYFPFIEVALQKYNVPDDFKYLLFLESTHLSHNVLDGLMRPDSKGFWQMRTSEAKAMQLAINEDIDERNHIILSSNALAKFFAENNELLDNWIHTLLTKELGFTQTGEVIDKSLAGKKTMTITKDTHIYILSFLAHYITFKDKINPDPKSIKLLVYQEEANKKVQEVSQKFALTESVSEFNSWNINPDEGLPKPYLVFVPVLPDEEEKVKTILSDKLIENEAENESDNSDENVEEETGNEGVDESENTEEEGNNVDEKSETETEETASENTEEETSKDTETKDEEVVEKTSEGDNESVEIVQPTGDFPVLKNQSPKEINGKTYVFVEANGIPAMIAQADQTATDLAKASGLTEEKFMKYNEISSKDLQAGTVYYLNKKNKIAGTKTHLLQESEDLTDVSQMYGIRKANLLTYNILSDNPKFIKYHQIADGETEIMGESVVEDDSVFVGGRVLNLQTKLISKPQFKFLRRIKKIPVITEKLEILNPTADAPILEVEGLESTDDVAFDSGDSENTSETDENTDDTTVSDTDSGENTEESSTKAENSEKKESSKKTTTYQKMPITSDYYIARPNDSWSVIAYIFSIPINDLYLWNGSNAETILYVKQKVRITQPPAMPKPDVHIVARGETVSTIAQRYGMSQDDLVRRNMLLTKKLPVGCKLYLSDPKPAQGWHTVKPKETFFSIARLYGISFRYLLEWNNMTLKSKIYKGSKLALEAGLVSGTKSKNVSQPSTNTENTAQNSGVTDNGSSSESAISESTASVISPVQTGMPDIPDPATLTMQITSKKIPDTEENNPETPVEDPNIYTVKNDTENIYEIAGTIGVSTSSLKKWNDLPSGTMDLPKGTKLRITSPEPTELVQESTDQPEETPSTTEESQVSDVSENTSENTESQEVTSEVTEQPTENAENTMVIPTDSDGNDPASLTASIIQANADAQNQDSGEENTASKNMNLDASYYYEAEFGDAIDGVAEKFGITEDQLFKWNPDLDPDTSGFWGGEKLIIKDPNQ